METEGSRWRRGVRRAVPARQGGREASAPAPRHRRFPGLLATFRLGPCGLVLSLALFIHSRASSRSCSCMAALGRAEGGSRRWVAAWWCAGAEAAGRKYWWWWWWWDWKARRKGGRFSPHLPCGATRCPQPGFRPCTALRRRISPTHPPCLPNHE